MTTQLSNNIRYATALKKVDYANDVFKMILMDTGFTFDPDTHAGYADVSASELATGAGYTAGGATMAGVSVVQNNTTNKCDITWNSVTWTATGTIGPGPGAIIYDDTITLSGTVIAKTIVGYIDFGGDQTQASGGIATVSNPTVRL